MVAATGSTEKKVEIPAGRHMLNGYLRLPENPCGVIVFAHGSGSGRFSPRNQFVSHMLEEKAFATLLLDLLDEEEAYDRHNIFNIELLAARLLCAADWVRQEQSIKNLPIGYFGASTGAGAALVAAAHKPESIFAIVSRGGRPDLAADFLNGVKAPTLLIVGGRDDEVIQLNEKAMHSLHCQKQLVIVPGATHLFEERGTLQEAALLARDWFIQHLPASLTLENTDTSQ